MTLVWLLRNLPVLAVMLGGTFLVLWGGRLIHERTRLSAELGQVQRQLSTALIELDRVEEAARIHRAHLARAEEAARRWSLIANDLQRMEGQDAPLSPLLGHIAERLYQTRP
ncbi:hypothetical protein ACFP4H_14830 [Pseudophaeobacter arcticus]|jgi:hypothetical protein|uniref:hypothetical protein n=1 Tax=Pseudophaeobacter arcticus TaxID=385492 RepID=UPI00041ABA5D|nr:hypothetical protein [Pseudophaeobacter arcticus]